MNTKLVVVLVGTATVAVLSGVAAVANTIRTNRIVRKLTKAIGKVEEATDDKITDAVVEKAINRAADKHVDKHMQNTESEVVKAADRNLDIQAKNAVNACARDMRKQVAEKISQQAADLDIEDLKKEIRDQAERHVIKKLDGVLDDSAKKFQDQLDSTQKIFNGISRAMLEKEKEKEDSGHTFHIVLD